MRLSGKEVIAFCEKWDFVVSRQKGSHVNLLRVVSDERQVLTVPNHKELDRGTLHEIFKKLQIFLPEQDLKAFFYT